MFNIEVLRRLLLFLSGMSIQVTHVPLGVQVLENSSALP